jgi:hypothetical protein
MTTEKTTHMSHQPPHLASLGRQMTQLWQVEDRMEGLFRQLVRSLDEESLARASEQMDELVLNFPDLRLTNLGAYPAQAQALLAQLDLESGPLPGFGDAMAQVLASCITPGVILELRHKLIKLAAHAAANCSEWLPTIAIAFLSLGASSSENLFVEMVACASAIETTICASLGEPEPISVDVSTWLAAEPSDALIAAVGEERAHYYASIPGILPFLDQERVLFGVDRFAGHVSDGIDALVDAEYKALLCTEIRRARHALRRLYPANSIADVEMLTVRALDALDELPPHVNPLLQAIFVQSWVRFLCEVC